MSGVQQLFLCLMCLSPLALFGQEVADPQVYVPKSRGMAVGVHVATNGLGADCLYFHRMNRKWEHVVFCSISSLKDNHEHRISPYASGSGGRKYVYDKKNYAYVIALTYGAQRNILHLDAQNKISWNVGAAGGPAFTILKPYFVDVFRTIGQESKINPEAYNSSTIQYPDIMGESDFFQGLSKMSIATGLSFNAFTTLNFAGTTLRIRSIMLGARADLYFQALPIMDTRQNQQFYVCGYLGLVMGNNW